MSESAYTAILDTIDEECLEHHGILGMKWGIRRYQNPDGTLTALGKKHLNDGKTQKAIDKWEQKKSTAILKGDEKFVKKNIDWFSNDEIAKLKGRVEAKTSISDLQQSARKVTEEKLRSWSNMLQNVANGARNAIDIYNAAAKVSNSLLGGKMKMIKDAEDKKNGIESINSVIDEYGNITKQVVTGTHANGIKYTNTFNPHSGDKSKANNTNANDSSDNNPKPPAGGGGGDSDASFTPKKSSGTPNVDAFMQKSSKSYSSGEQSTPTPNTARFMQTGKNAKTFASGEQSHTSPSRDYESAMKNGIESSYVTRQKDTMAKFNQAAAELDDLTSSYLKKHGG